MSGKGQITSIPERKLRLLLVAQLAQLGVIFLLGAWWGSLMLRQAETIYDLEKKLNLPVEQATLNWDRTQRMVYWEGGSFFALLLASTLAVFFLYWRDQRRTKGLQAFFASVTHELRTPLTSIRLQAESISETLASGAPETKLVQRLLQDSQRLESQVERTLELARVEGGGKVYIQPLRLKPLIERSLSNWQEAQPDRLVVNWKSEPSSENTVALGDAGAMSLILKNLLENSIRHSNRTTVSIWLEIESSPHQVVLKYHDDGKLEGELKTLGLIFSKGPSSQGAGVGLYLVSELMKKMGGEAEFKVTESGALQINLKFRPSREEKA
jgi:signal transduction histidine kinase